MPTELILQNEIQELLNKWLKSDDVSTRSDAVRAQASLATIGTDSIPLIFVLSIFFKELKGPKFVDGIYLLHSPTSKNNKLTDWDMDIVFIHGVAGHALGTWKQWKEMPQMETIDSVIPTSRSDHFKSNIHSDEIIWPRDWLAQEFPKTRVRIISVGYNVFLSKWSGYAGTPLKEQSQEIAKKLNLARVGSKPIVWVCHSFGGLVVKEILSAADRTEYKEMQDQTKGVVFFATPHRGSPVALYAGPYTDYLFRGTPNVHELKPDNQELINLHENFSQRVAPVISTLSLGENEKTCIGSKYYCFDTVSRIRLF